MERISLGQQEHFRPQQKNITKSHTRIHKVESGRKCDSQCSVASDFKEHVDEEAAATPDLPKN